MGSFYGFCRIGNTCLCRLVKPVGGNGGADTDRSLCTANRPDQADVIQIRRVESRNRQQRSTASFFIFFGSVVAPGINVRAFDICFCHFLRIHRRNGSLPVQQGFILGGDQTDGSSHTGQGRFIFCFYCDFRICILLFRSRDHRVIDFSPNLFFIFLFSVISQNRIIGHGNGYACAHRRIVGNVKRARQRKAAHIFIGSRYLQLVHAGQHSGSCRIANDCFCVVGACVHSYRSGRRYEAFALSIGSGCAHSYCCGSGGISAVQQDLQRNIAVISLRIRATIHVDAIRVVHYIVRPCDTVRRSVRFYRSLYREIINTGFVIRCSRNQVCLDRIIGKRNFIGIVCGINTYRACSADTDP